MDAVARLTRGLAIGLALLPLLQLSCRRGVPGNRGMGGRAGSAGASGGIGAAAAGGHAGAGAAASGNAGSGGQPTGPSTINLDGSPVYARVQRLTNAQWERAVTDVLRFASPANLSRNFATPALPDTDFANNEKRLFVDRQAALDFEAGSEAAAAIATGSADALARLYPGTDVEGFVRALGRRAFRRPLTPAEVTKYQGVFTLGENLYGAGFAHGAGLVIRAMLQSPRFLYRSELGPTGAPLDGYEVASKLSFWLLGTTPSDDLLDAAAAGELDAVDGVERVARAMLERPAAAEVMRDFHAQLYNLDRYDAFDRAGVPASVAAELAETSSRFFDDVFARDEGLREILTSTRAFVGPGLASSYGVDPPPLAIEARVLDASRIGYFMQVPFLLLNALPDGPATIRRGVAVSSEVLCANVPGHPAPFPSLMPLAPGHTNRERVEALTARCGSCHTDYLGPLGFAFEGFDGTGRARDVDNGVPVNTAGSYPFEDGTRQFADARELMRIMADGTQAHTCYAKKLTGYALQRDIVAVDRPLLDELAAVSRERSLKEMVISLVRNPAFRLRQEGTP
jgi:hypothetical protein